MIAQLERVKYPLLVAVLCAGAIFAYLFGSYAYNVNHQFGFPLDDPWIHLQFAKNLHDYGSFSYFKNEMVTAGSTSPLYTFLLAFGFFLTSNEMVLSYVLGGSFLLVAAYFFFRIVSFSSDNVFIALSPLLLLLEPRMQWAAFSGMETTLFICLLHASLYCYQSKKAVPFGVASGLLIWARPEAIIFFIAIVIDVAYKFFWVKVETPKKKNASIEPPSLNWLKKAVIILAAFAITYVGFNLYLSGSIFPNTFAAKVKYYGGSEKNDFPLEVFHFLTDGHMAPIAILALLGIGTIVVRIVRRLPQSALVPLLFSVGTFMAYWTKLPYLYQEGRYMMPVIPFALLLAMAGIDWVVALGAKALKRKSRENFVSFGTASLIVVLSAQCVIASWNKRLEYAEMCKYISDRQVRTAHWLNEHTPESAIIGTHDIGAIAFYSGRKIADMVGLVSPEAIEGIGSLEKLNRFLLDKKVTHLALLRNWFEVVNQNPLFKTDERYPEIMEVFAFTADGMHLTPQNVTAALSAAGQYLYQGRFDIAERILQQAIAIDPQNSKAHHLMATVFMATNRLNEAAGGFGEALKLHPDFLESHIGLAQVAVRQGKRDEGIAMLESLARNHPSYPTVFRALADLYNPDSDKSKEYMKQFEALTNAYSTGLQ
jgi:tetratricopeptide (TPR) repeat protein